MGSHGAPVRFEARAESVSDARHLARDLAADAPPDLGERLELVVSELTANAVRHARTPFTLSIRVAPTVRVEVTDGSRELPVQQTPSPWADGGRGLWLVASSCERWGVTPRSSGKVVWADFGPLR